MSKLFLLPVLFFAMLLAVPAFAAIYVDNSLAADCSATYSIANRNCSGSDGYAYNTLLEAANVAVAGDTVLVRGGTFSEMLRPANSGTAQAYITFKNYASETATITGSSLKPAIDLGNPDTPTPGKSYIIIEGLKVDNVGRWLYAVNAHHIIIRNNTFSRSLDGTSKGGLFFQNANDNKVINNTMTDCAQDNISLLKSNRNLIQGNTITKGAHADWTIKCGNFNVIRDNYFFNDREKIGEIFDCGPDSTGRPPGFNHELVSLDDTKYNLVESNRFDRTGNSGNSSPYSGIQFAGQNTIIRKNLFYEAIGPALSFTYYTDEAKYNHNNRTYNNVLYKTDFAGVSISNSETLYDNIFKNNILAESAFVANDTRWSWYTSQISGKAVQLMIGRAAGFVFENNDFFSSQGAEDHWITHGTRTGGYLTQPHNLGWWQTNFPSLFFNNLGVAPNFVNEQTLDFSLNSGSPLIDAGAFLTTTTSAGTGTSMQVADATYFYDGFGIEGETGDIIQLQGQTETATITDIDYSNNTLSLNKPLSWTAGQRVSLAFAGTAPDIGAFESGYEAPVPDCGNDRVEAWETCFNCPRDVICAVGTMCCGNICKAPDCTAAGGCGAGQQCINPSQCNAACQDINCSQGAITPTCYCQGLPRTTGYCCSNVWQAMPCQLPVTCGNGSPDVNENCSSCPQDVKCSTGKICCNATCIAPECSADANCSSGQHCTSSNPCTGQCTDCDVNCSTNIQCNDNNPDTNDSCENAGTCDSYCKNEPLTCGGIVCQTGQICCNNTCTTPTCTTTSQCNDSDVCTRDSCSTAGTCTAQCSHTAIPKCGWKKMAWTTPSCFPIAALFTITVKDETNMPLEGVEITYGTQKMFTSAEGKVEMLGEKSQYTINAAKEGYYPLTARKLASATCKPAYTTTGTTTPTAKGKIKIEILETPYVGRDFAIKITDNNSKAVQGATITYSNQTAQTNEQGEATLTGEKSKYTITATSDKGNTSTRILPRTYMPPDQNTGTGAGTPKPFTMPLDIIALAAVVIVGVIVLLRARASKEKAPVP